MDFNQTRSFNLGLAKELSIEAALVFDELSFWATRGKRSDGLTYHTYKDMMDRLPLSEYQLRSSYKKLAAKGYIEYEIKKANGVPTVHFRILKNLRMETEKTSESDTEKTSESITATNPATNNINTLLFVDLVEMLGYNSNRVKFTPGRKAKLAARLRGADEQAVRRAALALSRSPWHMGENPNGIKYADIDFLLRNDEMIERWSQHKSVKQLQQTGGITKI